MIVPMDPNKPQGQDASTPIHPATDLPCTPDEGAHADADAEDPREYPEKEHGFLDDND